MKLSKRYKLAILVNIIAPYRLPIYRFLSRRFIARILFSGGEENRQMWDHIEHTSIDVRRVWGISFPIPRREQDGVYDWRFLHINPGYFTELLRFRPDAVISNEMGFRSLVALIYARLFGKPLWVWWGGTLHTERSIGVLKSLWRRYFSQRVPRWISYGRTSTEYLLHLGVPRERILQIQNCVDEKLFIKPAKPLYSFPVRPVLLYVGQFIGRKGIDLLLESAQRVQAKGYDFTLALAGDGPEKGRLQSMAEELQLSNVFFLDPERPENMPRVYKSADVLVFPTLEDVWGLVVNEALWSGLPVIASIYAGATTEILPQENWFDPLDANSFDAVLERAVKGELAPPDTSLLLPCEKVARLIEEDIYKVVVKEKE